MQMSMGDIWSMATAQVQGRTDFSTSELSLYTNLAYQEVSSRIAYDGFEAVAVSSTTSGGYRVALPNDFGYVVELSNLSVTGSPGWTGNWGTRELKQYDTSRFDSLDTQLGRPVGFARFNNYLELWPSPDSTYSLQLRYVTQVSPLMSSTSTPAIDERWHPAIAYKTAAMLAGARQDLESEAAATGRYLSYMGSTPTDLALKQRVRGSGMRVSIPTQGRR